MYKIINRKKLIATIAADFVGETLFWPAGLFKKARDIHSKNIGEILIIRTAYMGDVVMTLPILKPLKERFLGSRITFLTSTGANELLINNPYVDEIVTYNPFWFYSSSTAEYFKFIRQFRKRRFDLVIEARGDIRDLSFLVWPLRAKFKISYDVGGGGYLLTHVVPYKGLSHKVEYHLNLIRYLGCNTDDIDWTIYLGRMEKKRVKEIMRENNISKPFISIHPGSRLPLKMWPAERYALLSDMIITHCGIPVVFFGSEGEKELVNTIANMMSYKPVIVAGKLSLREMAGILSETALFICNDSAPLHIAAAMKTPTVGIFGPSKSVETGPYGEKWRVVEKHFPCRFTCDESVCRHNVYHGCMRSITLDDVFNAARELIR